MRRRCPSCSAGALLLLPALGEPWALLPLQDVLLFCKLAVARPSDGCLEVKRVLTAEEEWPFRVFRHGQEGNQGAEEGGEEREEEGIWEGGEN